MFKTPICNEYTKLLCWKKHSYCLLHCVIAKTCHRTSNRVSVHLFRSWHHSQLPQVCSALLLQSWLWMWLNRIVHILHDLNLLITMMNSSFELDSYCMLFPSHKILGLCSITQTHGSPLNGIMSSIMNSIGMKCISQHLPVIIFIFSKIPWL